MTAVQSSIRGLRRLGNKRGVTFVDVIVAVAILLGFSTVALVTFTQLNRFASTSRLRAQALVLAEQRIEEIMTASWQPGAAIPPVLTPGTRTENNIQLNTDTTNQGAGLSSAFTSTTGQVLASRTTQITSIGTRSVRATVTVTFNYTGRAHTVTLTTLRVTDSI